MDGQIFMKRQSDNRVIHIVQHEDHRCTGLEIWGGGGEDRNLQLVPNAQEPLGGVWKHAPQENFEK